MSAPTPIHGPSAGHHIKLNSCCQQGVLLVLQHPDFYGIATSCRWLYFCRYQEYREPYTSENKYAFTKTFWHITAAQFAFCFIFVVSQKGKLINNELGLFSKLDETILSPEKMDPSYTSGLLPIIYIDDWLRVGFFPSLLSIPRNTSKGS